MTRTVADAGFDAPRPARPVARARPSVEVAAAPRPPVALVARDVARLQRGAGNAAVARSLAPAAPASAATPLPASPTSQAPVRPPVAPAVRSIARFGWSDIVGGVRAAAGAVAGGLGAVRSRVLGRLAEWARRIPGYDLLCFALGRDPVADRPVPRTAQTLVQGVLGLVPGGAAIWATLRQSGAVDRAFAWLGEEIPRLGITWDAIRALFSHAWDALRATDLLDPSGAWQKIAGVFGPPLARLRAFAAGAATKVMELVFEAVAGGQVMAVVRRAGGALSQIVRDPIGFARNLIGAVRGGFARFAANIGRHLQTGLFGWLTGALRGAIQLPERLDLRGVLSLVVQLLGLTWAALRDRLVRLTGASRVAALERAVDWVRAIATGGLTAAWQQILGFATGLVDQVVGGIRSWVAQSVVGAAITRLVTMLNPAGAVIQAILAVYNTVRFLMERAQQIAMLASSVFDSIGAIASGAVGGAVAAVETALSRALPVAISFLARLLGLGDVATPIRRIVTAVRAPIDRALDRVAMWLVGLGRRVVGGVRSGAGAVRRGVAGVREWWRARSGFTATDGTRHTVFFEGRGRRAQLTVASTPAPVNAFLDRIRAAANAAADESLRATFRSASALAARIDTLKSRVESGPEARRTRDIDALNLLLERLAKRYLPRLLPLDTKSPASASGSSLAPDGLIRFKFKNYIARITAVEPAAGRSPSWVRYVVVVPRTANPVGAFRAADQDKLFEVYRPDLRTARQLYLGGTPAKDGSVGRQVEARMAREGKLRTLPNGAKEVLATRPGIPRGTGTLGPQWWKLEDCDMGHIIDAVTWWNAHGRLTGARSPEVDAFMGDPDNYEFEPRVVNQARGRELAARGVRYLAPAVGA